MNHCAHERGIPDRRYLIHFNVYQKKRGGVCLIKCISFGGKGFDFETDLI